MAEWTDAHSEPPPCSRSVISPTRAPDSAGLSRVAHRDGKEVVVKTDDRGRTLDIDAVRHTFRNHLSKADVPLRTAQAAMRHSDPSLTANVYTDPKLLDMAAAVASLPDLPLGAVGVRAAAAN